ncbi:MAG: monovalent cation/H+ antiporter complex subunit F [Candidatus Omnitrophica bacterium]|nr:monovalent cation/H+ antiporter complex subunit F [Candidatus Omnitrophota bacterium]
MRRLRWFLGLVGIIVTVCAIFFLPLPSLLEWQSLFLKRAFFVLMLSGVFSLWRIVMGPTPVDRAAALDILGILILGFCAILGISTGRDWYIDIGIAWALQSFISILALGKYLEGRQFDE